MSNPLKALGSPELLRILRSDEHGHMQKIYDFKIESLTDAIINCTTWEQTLILKGELIATKSQKTLVQNEYNAKLK